MIKSRKRKIKNIKNILMRFFKSENNWLTYSEKKNQKLKSGFQLLIKGTRMSWR